MLRNRRPRPPVASKATRKLRSSIGRVIEHLEDRKLLAATPIIDEFLADNTNGLQDQFGNSPDWIEIRNPVSQNFDIGGYYLTDNPNNLTKWQFPAGTLLGGGSYMVVFASGDDITTPGQPLHTNFSLSTSPGFVGLVAPDGVTVLSSYDYPQQLTNTSYGIAVQSTSTTLVNPGALVKTFIPANGNLGTTWTAAGFNDNNASWKQGTTGVGYDADPAPPPVNLWSVRMVDTTAGPMGTIADATAALNGTPNGYTIASDTSTNYQYVNLAGGGNFAGDYILPNGETNVDAPGRSYYALRVTANVTIPVGTWTMAVGSDDGFRLRIPGVIFNNRVNENFTAAPNPSPADTLVYGAGRGHAVTSASFTITGSPLVTTLQLDSFEGAGGDDLEFSAAVGARTSFDTTNFSLIGNGWNGWTVSAPDVSPNANYRAQIQQDVQADMYNLRSSAYMRIPFAIAGSPNYDMLRLRMKYDDGFVAYLNGTKIAERNAPTTPVWNSVATAEHPDAQALVFEDMDVPIPAGLLINGTNILAIHGLNISAADADFLIMPSLLGLNTVTMGGERYMTTPTPGIINSTSNVNGVVEDTNFSVKRGFFDAPFDVIITTDTLGAEIRYTLNGSAPTPTNGTVYSGPIHIDKTSTLRALAWKTGLVSSNVDTESYIFLADVITQSPSGQAPNVGGTQWPSSLSTGQALDYGMDPNIVNNASWSATIKDDLKAIPSINIAISLDDFLGATNGFYSHPGNDGLAWERPVSVELINPDGTEGFQVNAGIRVRGGFSSSTTNPKHSFRLFFRQQYGDSSLKYPINGTCDEWMAAHPWTPDESVCPTDEFDSIDLRTFQNYSWSFGGDSNGIFMRDQLSRDMQLSQGETTSHGKYFHLYIDGQYWGIYNTDERPEADFSASYFGGQDEDYDTVKPNCGGCNLIATDGDLAAWQQLYNLSTQLGKVTVAYTAKSGNPAVGQTVTQLNSNATGVISSIGGASGLITITVNSGFFTNTASNLIRVDSGNFVTPDASQPVQNPGNDIYFKMQGLNPDGTRNPNYPVLLDMDNLIDYMLVILHGGNLDAPITNFGSNNVQNNWFGTRPRDGSNGFRFFAHDSEHTILPFNSASFDRTGPWPNPATANNPWTLDQSNPQYLWQQLGGSRLDIGSSEFRLRVADHLHAQFFNNGPLTATQVLARFDNRKNELDRAVVGESARWGNTSLTRNTWLNAVSSARNFLVGRSTTVFNSLTADGQYSKLNNGTLFNAPEFKNSATNQFMHGGDISPGFNLAIALGASNPAGTTIYYTLDGTDPRAIGGGISPTAVAYSGPIPLNTSTQPLARVRYVDGTNVIWSALTTAKFKYNLSAIHVSELMYSPAPPPAGSPYTADDFEYIELQNTGNASLQLGGMNFDEGITFTFPSMTLAAGARTLVVKNRAAFESRYGLGLPIAGEYISLDGGTFSNNGEDVNLRGPVGEQLIHFNYENGWAPITNGGGYSLAVRDPAAGQVPTPQNPDNPLSHSVAWRASNLSGGGPGVADPGINPETIVINEAMSKSSAATGDWIELKNLGASPMNIGGWFLSNDALNLKKYQIPAGTILPSGASGYTVFYSQLSFGNAANPGVLTPFDLDEVNGTDIYLTNNDGSGNVAGYREHADFGVGLPLPGAADISFGRYVKSNGATDFTQLATPTPSGANSLPVVGPIVISEVNYNPNAGDWEFIELENITDFPVQLWDPANPNNTWKMLTGVTFNFPTNTTIPGFGSIILIPQAISTSAFRTQYNVAPEVQIFQFSGGLDNAGEDVKLGRPLPPVSGPGGPIVPYLLVDKVKYGDAIPWPGPPDGTGPSLQRVQPVDYGNDPANWRAGPNHGNPGIVQAPQRPPVVNAGADDNATQGSPFSHPGSFTDVNTEQTFTGSVNWGDGGATQPLTINANKTYTLNHTYLSAGTFTITVTITDSYPQSGNDTFQVTIGPDHPPTVNAGADASPVQGDMFTQSGSFADVDPGQSWTGTVNWGDGSATAPLTLNANKTFNLNHVFPNVGDFTVTVTVSDNANISGTDTLQVSTVPDTLPVVTGPADQTLPQGGTFSGGGSFNDPNTQQTWSATVNWGEGGAAVPLTLNANKTYNLNHAFNNPGTYTVVVTVTDSVGGSGTDTVMISVPPNARAGTSGPDTYTLRLDPANSSMLQFFENRTIAQGPSYVLAYSVVPSYSFSGGDGDDTFIIDTTFGNPIPSGGVSFNGGFEGANGDMIQLIGGSANDSLIVRTTQVQFGSSNINYNGTENIRVDGNGGDDTLSINNFIFFSPIFNGGPGNNTLVLNAGEYDWSADAAASTPNLNLVANNGATYVFTATQHLGSLTLNGTSSTFVFEGSNAVIVTNALSMSAGAIFDLGNNDLVVQATAENRQDMLASINGLLHSGRNGGTWDGPGINSSTATANAAHTTGLAGILNDKGDGTPVRSSVEGQSVNINSILLKYTYNGDANQDGVINPDDYARIDAGFASNSTGYYNGDFDYSGGPPDADDFFLVDKTFHDQGAALGGEVSAVQELAAPQAAVTEAAPAGDGATNSGSTRVAVKAPLAESEPVKKKHQRHHKRDVIDQVMSADSRMFRRRD